MILIDMEMPKNCVECHLHDIDSAECPICAIRKEDYSQERFHECPLKAITKLQDTEWTPCNKPPKKYGWYICSLKDGRVCSKYWNGKTWIDNIRKHMFELYDIRSKLTGEKLSPEDEDIDWTGWVEAWMPFPNRYQPKEKEHE